MADTKEILSVVVCNKSAKLADFAIGDKQIIFMADSHRIALDYGGKRTFYNQLETIETENARTALSPRNGTFYFVISTAVLWYYNSSQWIQVTSPPVDYLFIGDNLPDVGSENKLYVDKTEREVSVWDNSEKRYVCVANATTDIDTDYIDGLFQ